MCNICKLCATVILLIFATSAARAGPILFEVDLVDTLATGDQVNGLGFIEWDATTLLMTRFDWDFLEGDQPGGKGNAITPSWLTSAFGSGTYGAALWEVITGEDVFPGMPTEVIALESDNAISPNGFPSARAEFYSVGLFKFYDDQFDTGEQFLSGEGTISLRSVPAPATLALFGLGLAGLGWSRRKKS